MRNEDIETTVREHGYVLPSDLYIQICNSPQVDHVLRDGEWYDIWTNDGTHWRVRVWR